MATVPRAPRDRDDDPPPEDSGDASDDCDCGDSDGNGDREREPLAYRLERLRLWRAVATLAAVLARLIRSL